MIRNLLFKTLLGIPHLITNIISIQFLQNVIVHLQVHFPTNIRDNLCIWKTRINDFNTEWINWWYNGSWLFKSPSRKVFLMIINILNVWARVFHNNGGVELQEQWLSWSMALTMTILMETLRQVRSIMTFRYNYTVTCLTPQYCMCHDQLSLGLYQLMRRFSEYNTHNDHLIQVWAAKTGKI